jgi:rfaE bifunctional protein nucleotidyltransferase chain/domain
MAGPLVIVGDALLDRDTEGRVERLSPDAPVPVLEDASDRLRPGGAGLAALLAARQGVDGGVVLVTALGHDRASAAVRSLLPGDVAVVALPLTGPLPEKTRLRTGGRTLLRLDRGAGTPGPAGADAVDAVAAAGALLVCDYGRGVTADPRLRAALTRRAAQAPLVWDPHPRGSDPVPGTRLATPNQAEAARLAQLARRLAGGPAEGTPGDGSPVLRAAAAAERLLAAWPAEFIAVTLGSQGALLAASGQLPLAVPAAPMDASDTCGAGDQFAAAAATALRQGALVSEAVTAAVEAATGYLAAGGASGLLRAPVPRVQHEAGACQAAEAVRARGGTVVATGGCFDVLHAGHVSMLRAARSLGDCLLVCLNSDASVRRLKGPGRPLNPAADRAAVLAALDCVDSVVVFGEDTPQRVLTRLRPHIWVKGGDYDGRELPETATLRGWGGQVVTVPYLTGRSTSRLAAAAASASGLAARAAGRAAR